MAYRYPSRNYNTGYCRASNKVCHASEYAAKMEVRRLVNSRTNKNSTIRTFKCDHCGCWHVGHTEPWKRES